MINKNGIGFNSGFDFFKDYTEKNQIPFLLCLHAESAEVKAGKFNKQGEEILRFCEKNGIKVISGFEIGEELMDFRDHIHLNERGQKRWAKALGKEIQATTEPHVFNREQILLNLLSIYRVLKKSSNKRNDSEG